MFFSDQTSYEGVAEAYVRSADNKPFTGFYERPYILGNLPDLQGKKVLDLGCATGFYSAYCLGNGAEVCAVDASEKMIRYTEKACANDSRLNAFVHDIAEPFSFLADSAVDIIICSLVLHYIRDWAPVLDEFYRVLKNNGRCIISTHHPINDFTHFNREEYFSKRLIHDTWNGFDPPLQVSYFVRPLNEYIQPILDSKLKFLRLDEPMPSEELRTQDPAAYDRLQSRPAFLFFILEKGD